MTPTRRKHGSRLALLTLTALVSATSCRSHIVFPCASDDQCKDSGAESVCALPGYCAHKDGRCDSALRYGPFASEVLAGGCVPPSVSDEPPPVLPPSDTEPGSTSVATSTSATGATSTADSLGTTSEGAADTFPDEPSGGCTPVTAVLVATVAECSDGESDDIGACEEAAGQGRMLVDRAFSGLGDAAVSSFLRFEAAPTLFSTIETVELELTVPPDDSGHNSGEVWHVSAFDARSLQTGQPIRLGTVLSEDLGPLGPGAVAWFDIPPDRTLLSAPTFFGVFANSYEAIRYHNVRADARFHPRLHITGCQ